MDATLIAKGWLRRTDIVRPRFVPLAIIGMYFVVTVATAVLMDVVQCARERGCGATPLFAIMVLALGLPGLIATLVFTLVNRPPPARQLLIALCSQGGQALCYLGYFAIQTLATGSLGLAVLWSVQVLIAAMSRRVLLGGWKFSPDVGAAA